MESTTSGQGRPRKALESDFLGLSGGPGSGCQTPLGILWMRGSGLCRWQGLNAGTLDEP